MDPNTSSRSKRRKVTIEFEDTHKDSTSISKQDPSSASSVPTQSLGDDVIQATPSSDSTSGILSSSMVVPPRDWKNVWDRIVIMRQSVTAPVDTMGCERLFDPSAPPIDQRFQILVSLLLSSQTKDEATAAAVKRLISSPYGLTVRGVTEIPSDELTSLLYGIGFHNKKTVYMKSIANILRENYESDIPRKIEDVLSLPGIGPKMAHLIMQVAWGDTLGIGVDVHVHRITRRLGWTKDHANPEGARSELESWLPKEYWRPINALLVGFGQTVCLPTTPKCGECSVKDLCPTGRRGGRREERKRKK